MTMIITQITTIRLPWPPWCSITISTFQSLGANPVPMVYVVAVAGNCGLMLPSSAGGPAVAAGYVNLRTMFSGTVARRPALAVIMTIIIWPPPIGGFGIA
jgi:di/tricarboxylate transporter